MSLCSAATSATQNLGARAQGTNQQQKGRPPTVRSAQSTIAKANIVPTMAVVSTAQTVTRATVAQVGVATTVNSTETNAPQQKTTTLAPTKGLALMATTALRAIATVDSPATIVK